MGGSETNLEVDEVVSAAARLAVTSEELAAGLSGPLDQIRAINAAAPWGTDEAGREFQRSYLGSGETADAAVDGILDGTEALCSRARTLAEGTGVGAIETELQDQDDASQIDRLHAELTAGGRSPQLDEATAGKLSELRGMMRDPRASETLGADQVAEIEGFLEDAEQLAG